VAGWNGFSGGDPYFANADAGAAVLSTNGHGGSPLNLDADG
jgi:Amt family ammonium transporter